jgi:plasmid stabilization system protein ParE
MPATIVFSKQARKGLQEVYDWYEEQRENLGERFVAEVDTTVAKIAATPYASSIRYKNIRCRLMKIFPYLVHYIFDESTNTVTIYKIFHTSRKPFWNK